MSQGSPCLPTPFHTTRGYLHLCAELELQECNPPSPPHGPDVSTWALEQPLEKQGGAATPESRDPPRGFLRTLSPPHGELHTSLLKSWQYAGGSRRLNETDSPEPAPLLTRLSRSHRDIPGSCQGPRTQDLKHISPPGGRSQGPLLQNQRWLILEASSSAEDLKKRGHVCGTHPQSGHPTLTVTSCFIPSPQLQT